MYFRTDICLCGIYFTEVFSMKNTKTRALVESAILIALATILSLIKLVDLPYGGSITIASMFPIVILSYRFGLRWGCAAGLVYGIIQQLTGLSSLSYVTTWQSIVAVILLDYVIAYAVTGLGGIFRGRIKNQSSALAAGSLLVCLLRYACHVLSGATVWAGISIPTKAALIYSFIYNATYMLTETLIMVLVSVYIGSMIDFHADLPVRTARTETVAARRSVWTILAGLACTGALIFDVAAIFSKLQNAETGEFDITQIASANWIAVAAVTACAAIAAAALFAVGRASKKQNAG